MAGAAPGLYAYLSAFSYFTFKTKFAVALPSPSLHFRLVLDICNTGSQGWKKLAKLDKGILQEKFW